MRLSHLANSQSWDYLLVQRLDEPLIAHEVTGHVHVPIVDQNSVLLQRHSIIRPRTFLLFANTQTLVTGVVVHFLAYIVCV